MDATRDETGGPPDAPVEPTDAELVERMRAGWAAEDQLGEAETAEQKAALEAQRAEGLKAWSQLFLRYHPQIEAFARVNRLRSTAPARSTARGAAGRMNRAPVAEKTEAPTVETFINELYRRVWEQRKTASWRGAAPFPAWFRRVLFTILKDTWREIGNRLDKPKHGSADQEEGDEGPTDEGFIPRVDWEGPAEPSRYAEELSRCVARMPIDRRMVYKVSYSLPLTDSEFKYLAGQREVTAESVKDEVDRLYERLEERSDRRIASMLERRERLQGDLGGARERLRSAREILAKLNEAADLPLATRTALDSRIAAARRKVGRTVLRLRDLERRATKLDDEARRGMRTPSKRVATVLGTTANNVDKHLQRARADLERPPCQGTA